MIEHTVDANSGAEYWLVAGGEVARTLNLADDLNVDVDADGRLIGVELLRIPDDPVPSQQPAKVVATGRVTWTRVGKS